MRFKFWSSWKPGRQNSKTPSLLLIFLSYKYTKSWPQNFTSTWESFLRQNHVSYVSFIFVFTLFLKGFLFKNYFVTQLTPAPKIKHALPIARTLTLTLKVAIWFRLLCLTRTSAHGGTVKSKKNQKVSWKLNWYCLVY